MIQRWLAMVLVVLMVTLVGCVSDAPWRKATVTTYELLGIGVGEVKSITENLQLQGLVTEAQVTKIKEVYNKARAAYVAAGNALKLASAAKSAADRDAFLLEYDKMLADFKALSYEVYDLVKKFKKVSYLEVEEWIKHGEEGGAS